MTDKDREYQIVVILTILVMVLFYSLLYTGLYYIGKKKEYTQRIEFLEQKIEYLEGGKR